MAVSRKDGVDHLGVKKKQTCIRGGGKSRSAGKGGHGAVGEEGQTFQGGGRPAQTLKRRKRKSCVTTNEERNGGGGKE